MPEAPPPTPPSPPSTTRPAIPARTFAPSGEALLSPTGPLPLAPAAPVCPLLPPQEEIPPGGTGTVLLIDGDDAVCEVAARVLSAAGYVVHAATTADEALRLAGEKGPLHLLVVDLSIPDAGGKLAQRLALRRPDVPVLYLSVYPAEVVDPPPVPGHRAAVLAKPFGSRELLWAVRQAMAGTLAAC